MKNTTLKKRLFRSVLILFAFVFSFTPVFALDQETLKFYAKNNILYYDPSGTSCLPGSVVNLSGENSVEAMWNYLANTGLFTKEQIAGIIGNAAVEVGGVTPSYPDITENTLNLNPLFLGTGVASNQVYLFQWDKSNKSNIDTLLSPYNKYLTDKYYRETPSSIPIEDRRGIIETMLQYALDVGGGASTASVWIQEVQAQTTVTAAAEAFLVSFEGAQGSVGHVGAQSIQEYKAVTSLNQSRATHPYQRRDQRVNAANQIYAMYSSASPTTNSLGGSSDGSTVTIIGDSITNGSRNEILNKFPSADITSEVGRPFSTGVSIASDPSQEANYKFNNAAWAVDDGMLSSELRQNVVVALGSNDPDGLSQSDIDSMLSAIGADKNVYFVTNYMSPSTKTYASKYNEYKTGYEKNNSLFKAAADSKSNVYLIDWAAKVVEGDYLSSDDGLHPEGNGQKLFAELIYNAINKSTATSICDPTGGGATPWTGDIPWYNQCGTDNEGRSYQTTKAGPNGYPDPNGYVVCQKACGVFSMASILTMLTNTKVDPEILLDVVGKDNRFKSVGTDFSSLETYKNYSTNTLHKTMTSEIVSKNSYNETQYINYINNALRSGKFVWVAGNESPSHATTPFSTAGHFIAIRGIDASGNWLVIDPAGNRGRTNTFDRSFTPSSIYQHVQNNGTAIIGIGS